MKGNEHEIEIELDEGYICKYGKKNKFLMRSVLLENLLHPIKICHE